MTRGDDLEKAKRMMREAVEEYRKELDAEEAKRKSENPFGIVPSNRVETIAHAKWVCELRLKGRSEEDIKKPTEEDSLIYHEILEKEKKNFVKLFW